MVTPTAPTEGATLERGVQADRPRTADAIGAGESGTLVEGRSAPRLQAAEVPSIKGVRLRPFGAEATLVNISASGVLVECVTRLRLGTAVTVIFDGTFSPATAEGRVARSTVATVSKNGVLRYHVGIAFQNAIPLIVTAVAPSKPAAVEAAPVSPAAAPVATGPINRW
ncbi:MAG TPA: PilZ domain-containing protein [Vicinamibacterales bacterium]|nr:PilZ domain-containing protein [Vicinamibacterales bacterium]